MKISLKGLNEVRELKMLDKNGIDFARDWVLNLGAETCLDSDIDMYIMEKYEFNFWKKAIDKENDLNEFLNSFSEDFRLELIDRLFHLYQNNVENYPSIYSVFDLLDLEEYSTFNAVEFVRIDSKNYGRDEFELYYAEAGWQDWMLICREDNTTLDRDCLYTTEIKSIEEIQREGFRLSH